MDTLPAPAPTPAAPRVRLETLVALACCAAAALWIDLGVEVHRVEGGDSMLPVLVSLQKWTPFFWEQDRFGMLMPLLAMPVRDPLVNLLVQRGLYLFAGQCSILVAARWAFGAERWQLLGALGVALWMGLAPMMKIFLGLGHHPVAFSMLLGLGALLALEWRWPLAVVLMFLAHWVNVGLFLFLVPASLARAAAVAVGVPASGGARRAALLRGLREAGLSLGVGAAASLLARLVAEGGERSVALEFLPVAEWPAGWAGFWDCLSRLEWDRPALVWVCLAFAAAGAVAMAASRWWRQEAREPARIGLALLLAGFGFFLFMSTQPHVKGNAWNSRYLEPTNALVELSLLAPLVVPIARALGGRAFRIACALLGVLGVAGAAITFGPPQPGKIRETLVALSPLTPEVVSRHCTHVAGNYWKVWPAVVMANAERYRSGEQGQVWGISHRSVPTLPLSTAMPAGQMRIAIGLDDPESIGWLRRYGFSNLVLLERGEKIAVLGIAGSR